MEGGEPPRRPLTLASSLRMGPLRGGSYILRVAPQKRPHLKTLTLTLTAKEFGLAGWLPTLPQSHNAHTTAVTSLHTHEMRRTTHERTQANCAKPKAGTSHEPRHCNRLSNSCAPMSNAHASESHFDKLNLLRKRGPAEHNRGAAKDMDEAGMLATHHQRRSTTFLVPCRRASRRPQPAAWSAIANER